MAFSSIVNLPDPYAPITTGIGTGLAGLLEGLAQKKINQLNQQNTTTGLKSLGYSDEQAQALAPIARQNPQAFAQLIKGKQQQQREQQFANQWQALQGGREEGGIPTPRSPEEAFKVEELQLKKEKARREEYKPFVDRIENSYGPAKSAFDTLNALEEILNRGEVGTGLTGQFNFNEDSREYDSLLNQLVLERTKMERIPGMQGSTLFLELEGKSKPHRGLSEAAIRRRIQKMKESASEFITENKILNQMRAVNDDKLPEKAPQLLNKIKKIYEAVGSEAAEFNDGDIVGMNGLKFRIQKDPSGESELVYIGKQ